MTTVVTNMYTVNVIERWVPGVHNSMLTNMYIVNAVERWVPGVHKVCGFERCSQQYVNKHVHCVER